MQGCKPRATPCEQNLNCTNNAEVMRDVSKFREAVGSFIYLTCARPDISYIVKKPSRYFSEPSEEQWITVKHVLGYLKGTSEKELCYRKSDNGQLGLQAFSDANWADAVSDKM